MRFPCVHIPTLLAAVVVTLFCAMPRHASADAIMVTRAMKATTIAEVYIDADSIRVELAVGIPDLQGFRNILPNGLYERLGFDPVPIEERLPLFLREDWVIKADGLPLPGQITGLSARPRVERDPITGDPLPTGDEEPEVVVFIQIGYALQGHPSSITLRPPLHAESARTAADIGFVVYHRDLPVTDFRYLSGEETLDLDWDDPWYSKFRNRNLKRRFDAPVSAYLYVENFEVRKEIIVRPKDLQEWVDLGIAGSDTIPVRAQEELKQKVAAFLNEKSQVTIDGETPVGTLDRIHFVRRTLRRTGVIDPPVNMPVVSATLGVIYVYPRTELPERVSMPWELFSSRIQSVPSSATDEAGGLPQFLVPGDSILVWQNFLTNPTITSFVDIAPPSQSGMKVSLAGLACILGLGAAVVVYLRGRIARGVFAGAAVMMVAGAIFLWPFAQVSLGIAPGSRISNAELQDVVSGLLTNVYRAFDYREESDIYDTLERSVSGDLLTQIYLETRRQLVLQNQGGARVKVKEVRVASVESGETPGNGGLAASCTWDVMGSVGHWGHTHTRENRYNARFTIESIDGAWKITGLELLEEERLSQTLNADRTSES